MYYEPFLGASPACGSEWPSSHRWYFLGVSGSVVALFVRGYTLKGGAVAGFCVVSALAVVQGWMVASEIGKDRRLSRDIRNACYRGVQAKLAATLILGA